MGNIYDTMYTTLRVEAKVSLYLEKLINSHKILSNTLSTTSKPRPELVETKEALESVIVKLKILMSNLKKYRGSFIVHYLEESLVSIEREILELEEKSILTNVKRWIVALLEDVRIELRNMLKELS